MTKRAYILPALILIILFLLPFYDNLRLETKLPSQGWSRSFNLGVTSKSSASPYMYGSGSASKVFIAGDNGIMELSCNNILLCNKKTKEKISIPDNAQMWLNGDTIVYQDDEKLYLLKNGKTRQVAEGITRSELTTSTLFFGKNKNFLNSILIRRKRSCC